MARNGKRQKGSKRPMTEAEIVDEIVAVGRSHAWRDKVAAMADGRVQRAATYDDQRKASSRKACRSKVIDW